MKKAIISMFIVSLIVLTGCQQLSEKVLVYQENYEIIGTEREEIIGEVSDTIYESIDRSNSAATNVFIEPILQEGNDVTLPEGRYEITALMAGNVFVRDEHGTLLFHDIIARSPYGVERITVDVNGKHIIHVDGFDNVMITPVPTQLSNELSPGIWEVGKDIKAGNYTVKGTGLGYLQIFEQGQSPQVFEVIGWGSESVSEIQLKDGQKIKITGAQTVQFNTNDT